MIVVRSRQDNVKAVYVLFKPIKAHYHEWIFGRHLTLTRVTMECKIKYKFPMRFYIQISCFIIKIIYLLI